MSEIDLILESMNAVSELMALFPVSIDGQISIVEGLNILTRVYTRLEEQLASAQLLEDFEQLDGS